jgi:hypothetical protein
MLEFLRARPSLHSHDGDSLRLSSIFEFRVRSRASLELELIALRHQVTVLRQQHPGRPHLSFLDRLLLRSAVYIYERRAV